MLVGTLREYFIDINCKWGRGNLRRTWSARKRFTGYRHRYFGD